MFSGGKTLCKRLTKKNWGTNKSEFVNKRFRRLLQHGAEDLVAARISTFLVRRVSGAFVGQHSESVLSESVCKHRLDMWPRGPG